MTTEGHAEDRRVSGFDNDAKSAKTFRFSHGPVGQSSPQHCPGSDDPFSVLGEPLSIREVAQLIGCSVWTVRQRYLPMGLPHLRSGPQGKLIFFRDQIVRWILQQQQKGGR